jgi:hypothetical protein
LPRVTCGQWRSPQTNGFCERFHRTVKEEFFQVAFRKTLYESLDQPQTDLDRYLDFYNRDRAHQGYRTQGHTPYQAFLDGVNQVSNEVTNGLSSLSKEVVEKVNQLPKEVEA